MAIAFDAATIGGYSATLNGKTFAHTCTGSNLILFVGTFGAPNSDTVTGVTYAGTAMTKITSKQNTASSDARFSTLWYLTNPATGANNVVVSASSGDGAADSVSYTGASQTGVPDAFSTGSNGTTNTSFSMSVTTIADNCWVIGATRNDLGTSGVGAGTTSRVNDTNGYAMYDNGGAQTPPGSVTLINTTATATFFAGVIASFAPPSAAAKKTSSTLISMGIG